eukprot:1157436-Pelagomonas_calceolata.AAC.2
MAAVSMQMDGNPKRSELAPFSFGLGTGRGCWGNPGPPLCLSSSAPIQTEKGVLSLKLPIHLHTHFNLEMSHSRALGKNGVADTHACKSSQAFTGVIHGECPWDKNQFSIQSEVSCRSFAYKYTFSLNLSISHQLHSKALLIHICWHHTAAPHHLEALPQTLKFISQVSAQSCNTVGYSEQILQ